MKSDLKAIPGGGDIVDIADPFDLDNLRLPQNFAETCGVKKLLTTIPVRKPNPQSFVRVNPSPAFRGNFPAIELKDDRELYVVARDMREELAAESIPITLYTAITTQQVLFLWPVRLPGSDGKQSEWWRSLDEAAQLAMNSWIRIRANMSLGAYDIHRAEGVLPDPVWPELAFKELLKIGFRDRLVDRVDHPIVQRLRGLT